VATAQTVSAMRDRIVARCQAIAQRQGTRCSRSLQASQQGSGWRSRSTRCSWGSPRRAWEGASILAIPIMAQAFGARSSSAIMLGIMIVTDWAALWNYHAQADYKILVRTLPAAIAGIALGTLIGKDLSEATFKLVIGIIILVSTAIMFVQELKGGGLRLPRRWVCG